MTYDEYSKLPGVSNSEIGAYRSCQAAWFAEYVSGEWSPDDDKTCFIEGKLLEALLCDDQDALAALEQDDRLYKWVGPKDAKERELRAPFAHVYTMVDTYRAVAERSKAAGCTMLLDALDGNYQVPIQWTLDIGDVEVPCKALIDVERSRCLVDIKKAASFGDQWRAVLDENDTPRNVKDLWLHKWGYCRQAAWYTMGYEAVHAKRMPFYLLAVSSEKMPDVGMWRHRHSRPRAGPAR